MIHLKNIFIIFMTIIKCNFLAASGLSIESLEKGFEDYRKLEYDEINANDYKQNHYDAKRRPQLSALIEQARELFKTQPSDIQSFLYKLLETDVTDSDVEEEEEKEVQFFLLRSQSLKKYKKIYFFNERFIKVSFLISELFPHDDKTKILNLFNKHAYNGQHDTGTYVWYLEKYSDLDEASKAFPINRKTILEKGLIQLRALIKKCGDNLNRCNLSHELCSEHDRIINLLYSFRHLTHSANDDIVNLMCEELPTLESTEETLNLLIALSYNERYQQRALNCFALHAKNRFFGYMFDDQKYPDLIRHIWKQGSFCMVDYISPSDFFLKQPARYFQFFYETLQSTQSSLIRIFWSFIHTEPKATEEQKIEMRRQMLDFYNIEAGVFSPNDLSVSYQDFLNAVLLHVLKVKTYPIEELAKQIIINEKSELFKYDAIPELINDEVKQLIDEHFLFGDTSSLQQRITSLIHYYEEVILKQSKEVITVFEERVKSTLQDPDFLKFFDLYMAYTNNPKGTVASNALKFSIMSFNKDHKDLRFPDRLIDLYNIYLRGKYIYIMEKSVRKEDEKEISHNNSYKHITAQNGLILSLGRSIEHYDYKDSFYGYRIKDYTIDLHGCHPETGFALWSTRFNQKLYGERPLIFKTFNDYVLLANQHTINIFSVHTGEHLHFIKFQDHYVIQTIDYNPFANRLLLGIMSDFYFLDENGSPVPKEYGDQYDAKTLSAFRESRYSFSTIEKLPDYTVVPITYRMEVVDLNTFDSVFSIEVEKQKIPPILEENRVDISYSFQYPYYVFEANKCLFYEPDRWKFILYIMTDSGQTYLHELKSRLAHYHIFNKYIYYFFEGNKFLKRDIETGEEQKLLETNGAFYLCGKKDSFLYFFDYHAKKMMEYDLEKQEILSSCEVEKSLVANYRINKEIINNQIIFHSKFTNLPPILKINVNPLSICPS